MFNGDEMETPMVRVGNLDVDVTDSDLYELSKVGGREAIWAEVSKHHRTGQSLGEGYMCYDRHPDAAFVIGALNGALLMDSPVRVTPSTFTFNEITVKLHVSSEAPNMDARLRKCFQKFGSITLIRLYTDNNKNRYGYIIFDGLQAAAKAATALVKEEFARSKMYYGGKHLVDPQDPLNIVNLRTLSHPPQDQAPIGTNVLVDNLSFFVSDQYLREMFSTYGNISFCKVMHKPDLSNGAGRVTFSTRDGAMKAVAAMNGQYLRSSQIQVSLEGGEKRSSSEVDVLGGSHDDKKPEVDNALETGSA